MAHTDKEIAAALKEYLRGELTTKEIARNYRVSPATITVWATNSGTKLRSRGRRKQQEPSLRSRKIIELSQVLNYGTVGEQFGISKQAVHHILSRWQTYAKPKRPPFAPGDVILWEGQKFIVCSANIDGGTLKDSRGRLVRCVVWNRGGRVPKKIGTDENYGASA